MMVHCPVLDAGVVQNVFPVARSTTVTLPVGVPLPGLTTDNDQFTVNGCPTTVGGPRLDAFVIVVSVEAWFTVCDTFCE